MLACVYVFTKHTIFFSFFKLETLNLSRKKIKIKPVTFIYFFIFIKLQISYSTIRNLSIELIEIHKKLVTLKVKVGLKESIS